AVAAGSFCSAGSAAAGKTPLRSHRRLCRLDQPEGGIHHGAGARLVCQLGVAGMVLPSGRWSVSSLIKRIEALYAWFRKAATSLQSPLLLAVRLYWGWQFFQTGWGKLTNMSKTVDFFTSLGIPAPSLNAHFVALLEVGGGILLILGL